MFRYIKIIHIHCKECLSKVMAVLNANVLLRFYHICIHQGQIIFRYLRQEFLQLRSLKALLRVRVIKKHQRANILFLDTT